MCGANRFGRPDKRIAGLQSGLLSGRNRRYISKRAGFTLIELLVVISIIALLLALLMPVLQHVRSKAKATKCQAILRQWGLAFSMYNDDNDSKFFRYLLFERVFTPLFAYCPDMNDLLLCPMATKIIPKQEPINEWLGDKSAAWSHRRSNKIELLRGSYGLNGYVCDRLHETNYEPTIDGRTWRTSLVKNPSSIPVLTDCRFSSVWPDDIDPPPEYEDPHPPYKWTALNGQRMWLACTDRHNGGINNLFVDWSVREL